MSFISIKKENGLNKEPTQPLSRVKLLNTQMKKHNPLLLLFFLTLLPCNAQNQSSPYQEKLEEFRELFIQNNEIKTGKLSKYKIITYGIDECTIQIETIDYENSNEEEVTVTFPTSGAILKKNGELHYKTEAIKETIKNKITKLITINLYKNSKYIGLLLKLKNKEQYKIMQKKLKELSRYCKLEKK
ncbi:hypothetical protein MCEGE10_02050 [Flavobacteriaceae bacterium]